MENIIHISFGIKGITLAITTAHAKFREFKLGKSLVPLTRICIKNENTIIVSREVLTLLSVTDLHKILDLNFREVLFIDPKLVVLSPITDIGSIAYRLSLESALRTPNKDLLALYKLLSLTTTELPK